MPDGVIGKSTVDGLTLVTLSGELDVAVAASLRRDLTCSPGASRPDLVVDLRQVAFMDCSILAVLIAARNRVRAPGGCVRLLGPQPEPLRLLTLCGLAGVLCVHDAEATATAATCFRHGRASDGAGFGAPV